MAKIPSNLSKFHKPIPERPHRIQKAEEGYRRNKTHVGKSTTLRDKRLGRNFQNPNTIQWPFGAY